MMKSHLNQSPPAIGEMLRDRRIQRLITRYGIEVFHCENRIVLRLPVHDDKGRLIDLYDLEPNREGFIHPAQVVYNFYTMFEIVKEHFQRSRAVKTRKK